MHLIPFLPLLFPSFYDFLISSLTRAHHFFSQARKQIAHTPSSSTSLVLIAVVVYSPALFLLLRLTHAPTHIHNTHIYTRTHTHAHTRRHTHAHTGRHTHTHNAHTQRTRIHAYHSNPLLPPCRVVHHVFNLFKDTLLRTHKSVDVFFSFSLISFSPQKSITHSPQPRPPMYCDQCSQANSLYFFFSASSPPLFLFCRMCYLLIFSAHCHRL